MERKRRIKLDWKVFCVLIFFILIYISSVFSSNQASQMVTIKVEPIVEFALAGVDGRSQVKLYVDEHKIITESLELFWTTNLEGLKIQVSSNLPEDMQGNILKVRPVNLVGKASLSDLITIDEIPKDIVSGISREVGSCFLEYQATPKPNTHPDEHIITFSISGDL